MYLENHLFGNKYYPMTIDPLVTPLLRTPKRRCGRGVQKVGVYWGFAGMLAGFANDADGLEVELGEPARPARSESGVGMMQMGVGDQGRSSIRRSSGSHDQGGVKSGSGTGRQCEARSGGKREKAVDRRMSFERPMPDGTDE